jgi:hypothetical protein
MLLIVHVLEVDSFQAGSDTQVQVIERLGSVVAFR